MKLDISTIKNSIYLNSNNILSKKYDVYVDDALKVLQSKLNNYIMTNDINIIKPYHKYIDSDNIYDLVKKNQTLFTNNMLTNYLTELNNNDVIVPEVYLLYTFITKRINKLDVKQW